MRGNEKWEEVNTVTKANCRYISKIQWENNIRYREIIQYAENKLKAKNKTMTNQLIRN